MPPAPTAAASTTAAPPLIQPHPSAMRSPTAARAQHSSGAVSAHLHSPTTSPLATAQPDDDRATPCLGRYVLTNRDDGASASPATTYLEPFRLGGLDTPSFAEGSTRGTPGLSCSPSGGAAVDVWGRLGSNARTSRHDSGAGLAHWAVEGDAAAMRRDGHVLETRASGQSSQQGMPCLAPQRAQQAWQADTDRSSRSGRSKCSDTDTGWQERMLRRLGQSDAQSHTSASATRTESAVLPLSVEGSTAAGLSEGTTRSSAARGAPSEGRPASGRRASGHERVRTSTFCVASATAEQQLGAAKQRAQAPHQGARCCENGAQQAHASQASQGQEPTWHAPMRRLPRAPLQDSAAGGGCAPDVHADVVPQAGAQATCSWQDGVPERDCAGMRYSEGGKVAAPLRARSAGSSQGSRGGGAQRSPAAQPAVAWRPACCADNTSAMSRAPQPVLARARSGSRESRASQAPDPFAHFGECLPDALPAARAARMRSADSAGSRASSRHRSAHGDTAYAQHSDAGSGGSHLTARKVSQRSTVRRSGRMRAAAFAGATPAGACMRAQAMVFASERSTPAPAPCRVAALPSHAARLRKQAREGVPHAHDRLFAGFGAWHEVSFFTLQVCCLYRASAHSDCCESTARHTGERVAGAEWGCGLAADQGTHPVGPRCI